MFLFQAGQERFGNMTRVYYKEAVGALIVFDVSRPETLQQCLNWKKDLDQKVSLADGSHVPCVLLANKCDLEHKGDCVETDSLNKFCKENSIHAWFYTSPLNNVNIEESANCLIKKVTTICLNHNKFNLIFVFFLAFHLKFRSLKSKKSWMVTKPTKTF